MIGAPVHIELPQPPSWVRQKDSAGPRPIAARLKAIYPVSGYKNLDGFLEGLRKAGLAD